jgi:hypothetical protein
MALIALLAVAACGDDDDANPTSPSSAAIETVKGNISNLARSGPQGLDVRFRIDDFTIVRAAAGTPVVLGSSTQQTDALNNGQRVTTEGRRTEGFLDAVRITIDSL